MKNATAQTNLNFSAYPLKAITGSIDSISEATTLHIKSQSKAFGRIRIHPMANPYKEEVKPVAQNKPQNRPDDITENNNGWYGNYE